MYQFIYLFLSLPTPAQSFKCYEQKIFEFLWSNKPEKIKREDFYNNYEHGGFKLLNLEALCFSLKASFVKKLYLNEDWYSSRLLESTHLWFQKRLYFFLQIQPTHIHCINNLIGNASTFLKEAIQCWLCLQCHPPESRDGILQ